MIAQANIKFKREERDILSKTLQLFKRMEEDEDICELYYFAFPDAIDPQDIIETFEDILTYSGEED